MSWELLIYLIAFILQAVLLGIVMFQVRPAYRMAVAQAHKHPSTPTLAALDRPEAHMLG